MGTLTPTPQQLANIRADMGLIAEALEDTEISSFWGRVSGAMDEVQQHEATLALMARAAITGNINLADQRAGNTEEKLSQVMDNMRRVYEMFRASLYAAQGGQIVAFGNVQSDRQEPEKPVDGSLYAGLDSLAWRDV